MMRKIITLLVGFCLLFEQSGFCQVTGPLVLPAFWGGLTASDAFRPEHLRSITYEAQENNFRTILDKGSAKENDPIKLENSTRQLFKYFFIGLSLPNDSFWVNLRPDSPDNIIDKYLAKTDIGKVMLEADVQLKKDTAKYTAPDTAEGRVYWDKLYRKAQELFENENIAIPTLTRPWIVPDEIILRQSEDNAYIYKATLKVMLESDYLKDSPEYSFNDLRLKELNDYSSQLIRELILPKLTRDVNTAKRYASLRQVYFSLILAQWFKGKLQVTNHTSQADALASKIDSRDLRGVTSQSQWTKETYFKEYQKSFKNGEYNKQENVQSAYGISLRQYFSGGVKLGRSIQDILSKGYVKGKATVKLSLPNTRESLINIAYDPFMIKITEALQSGGLSTVKGNKNLPPGASVLNSQDGGYKTIVTPADLIRYAEEILKTPGTKLKVWLDIDNTIFDHLLNMDGEFFYPTQNFVSERLKQIKDSMSEQDYLDRKDQIFKDLVKECVFWEKRWLQAKKLKQIEGISAFLKYASEKNNAEGKKIIEVNLITNRPADPELREATIDILNSLEIMQDAQYSNIIFVGAGNGKAERIKNNINPDERVFFMDNNEEYVSSIADQLKDFPAAKVFYLDRSSHEGKFTYEELIKQAEALLGDGLKTPEDRAAIELFLGCAALEIAKLDKVRQAEKIAEVRSFMQRPGLGQPEAIDRTYIDLCLKDIEKSGKSSQKDGGTLQDNEEKMSFEGYLSRIEEARSAGMIEGTEGFDEFSHLAVPNDRIYGGVNSYNSRSLSEDAQRIYEFVLQNNPKSVSYVLEMGQGLGVASADMALLAKDLKKSVTVETVGLTPIAPDYRLTVDARKIREWICEYFRGKADHDLPGVEDYIEGFEDPEYLAFKELGLTAKLAAMKYYGRSIPLALVFELQNRGYYAFELMEEPFINKQYVGKFLDSKINLPGGYHFLYDNYGAFNYSLEEDPQGTIDKTLPLISADDGVLFAQTLNSRAAINLHWVEIPEDYLAIFGQKVNRVLIVPRKSSSAQKLSVMLKGMIPLPNGVYVVPDFSKVINLLYPKIDNAGLTEEAKDGGTVQGILRKNIGSIAVSDLGTFGAVVDAKKAWKIFQEKDKGQIKALSREFASQIAFVRPVSRPEFEKGMVQDVIDKLNEENVEDKETNFLIFVSGQGLIQGLMEMHVPKIDNSTLLMLWVLPELQRKGIGTVLLDEFFRILDERKVKAAFIPVLIEATDFYVKYLEEKGMTPQDYGFDKPSSGYNGHSFWISRPAIEKIARAAGQNPVVQDGGSPAETGGIDLRQLPIKPGTQVMFPAEVESGITKDIRLKAQWKDIRDLVDKGFLPESGRIKECLFYCKANKVLPAGIESMLACMAEILRIQEDLYLPTDPCLKEFLVLLESS
jgi:hypothetical protein